MWNEDFSLSAKKKKLLITVAIDLLLIDCRLLDAAMQWRAFLPFINVNQHLAHFSVRNHD